MSDDTLSPTKSCYKCRVTYPATPEYFHRDKRQLQHGKYKDGLTTICKTCRKSYSDTCKHCGVFFRTSPQIKRFDFCSYECRVLHRLGGVGSRHGRLTVLGFDTARRTKDGGRFVQCQCDCGTACTVEADNVASGGVRSCGCMRQEMYEQFKRGGSHTHGWKGGRRYLRHGYVVLHNPAHPNAMSDGYVLEHVSVMSAFLGRPMRDGESIHHKNGIRDDNRIDNLELWTQGQPYGQRAEDVLAWCKAYIAQYEADVEKLKTLS